MLRRLRVQGFKSLADLEIEFPVFTVLFGPNAAGKSNVLDALLVLSRLATERTLAEALAGPVRGHPMELFRLSGKGVPQLLETHRASFSMEADLETGTGDRLRYKVAVEIQPRSGALSVADEYLGTFSRRGELRGGASIEVVDREIHVRRKSKPARPRTEPLGLGHTQLSDVRFSGIEYPWITKARNELSAFRTYYLDPRVAMRRSVPPREVNDIGPLGEDLAPFLYRLTSSEDTRRHFRSIERTLKAIVPSVGSLSVDLDEKRGALDIQIVQNGISFSSRIVSEGTLRVLALCAIALNPWPGALVAFEEPENGVHPRRLELIANLLGSLSMERGQQVIVTTHSPLFCQKILSLQRENPDKVALLVVGQQDGLTRCVPLHQNGPLFEDSSIRDALTSQEDGWFEGLVLRGLVDG